MPELPEVETVRRTVAPSLAGLSICGVQVLRPQAVAYPGVAEFVAQLTQQVFSGDSLRRGKYLLLGLESGGWLGVHLRMTGRLLLRQAPLPVIDSHLRVAFALENQCRLDFQDSRAFGRLWYIPSGISIPTVIPALAALGPEPEDLRTKDLVAAFRRRTIPIKMALLDQTILAGLGNIYADESLFFAGIHPLTPAQKLSESQIENLVGVVQQVLLTAVAAGGTTLRDYVNAQGQPGQFQQQLQVYGRYQKPCFQCGTPIERLRLGGRSSHFCPQCQPLMVERKATISKSALPNG